MGTDFDLHELFGTAYRKRISASTFYLGFGIVCWVNVFFHNMAILSDFR